MSSPRSVVAAALCTLALSCRRRWPTAMSAQLTSNIAARIRSSQRSQAGSQGREVGSLLVYLRLCVRVVCPLPVHARTALYCACIQPVIAKLVSRHMADLEEMRRRDSAPVRACFDGRTVCRIAVCYRASIVSSIESCCNLFSCRPKVLMPPPRSVAAVSEWIAFTCLLLSSDFVHSHVHLCFAVLAAT